MSIIKAVFFDLGDTLVERSPEEDNASIRLMFSHRSNSTLSEAKLRKQRLHLKAVERATWNIYKPDYLLQIQTLDAELAFLADEFYPVVLSRFKVYDPPQSLLHTLAARQLGPETFQCFDVVRETLSPLRARGVLLGCISNALPSADGIFHHLGLWEMFDCLTSSYQEGCMKPGRTIHERALACLGVSGSKAIFVDDRPGFVHAARPLYQRAILLDRMNSRRKEDIRIERLEELVPLLDREYNTHGSDSPSPLPLTRFGSAFFRLGWRWASRGGSRGAPCVGVPGDMPIAANRRLSIASHYGHEMV